MKTISIITYYNAKNYGAFLQGYSLMKFLKINGFDVTFRKIDINEQENISELSNSFDKELSFELEKMLEYFAIEDCNVKHNFAVIGSDEVFNFNNMTYKQVSCFDGSDIIADKIISYAASIGGAKYSKLLLKSIRRLFNLKKLNSVSVRDERTKKLVRWFVGNEKVVRDVDPTLLVSFDDEIITPEYSDYILVYTYGFTDTQVEIVKRFASERKLRIIATGSYCSWCDENLVVSPFEWIGLIKNSQYVFTSTFHGTIFALKFQKQFVALVNNAQKVKDLLNEMGEEKRYYRNNTYSEFVELCDTPIDYSNLPLEQMIKDSQRNLINVLK